MLPIAGNRASYRPGEGCRVSSVASLEMATGLSASSMTGVLARVLRNCAMDESHISGRSSPDTHDDGKPRSAGMSAGSAQKHFEIMFGGADASCYPYCSTGAEGIATTISRRPN
nr:hypothetical protein FNV92_22600 [Bradyrhizobium cosmicum]